MDNRRDFIKKMAAAGALSTMPEILLPQQKEKPKAQTEKIWAVLIHLSFNMWDEKDNSLEFDDSVWNDALAKMVSSGLNMVVIDLGDAIQYESHPEIVIKNAWSKQRLGDELQKIRKMGLEPIPKLNFSACHDLWLGPYGRMLSTKEYYAVCGDLIAEVMELFDTPRFFHLGMDEENVSNQRGSDMMIVRQKNLWWGDLYFLFSEVIKRESRPWVWSDYVRYEPEKFARMMPKSVVQGNWYNGMNFDPEKNREVKAYMTLEAQGYDQLPGGSNYYEGTDKNIMNNVQFCDAHIADSRLLGFIQSPWMKTVEENRNKIMTAIAEMGAAKAWFMKNHKS